VGFDQKVWVLCRSLAADEDQVDGTFRIMAEGVSYDESAVHYVQGRDSSGIVHNESAGAGGGKFPPEYPVEEIILPPLGG